MSGVGSQPWNTSSLKNQNDLEQVRTCILGDLNSDVQTVNKNFPPENSVKMSNVKTNAWVRSANIKVDNLNLGSFLFDDGKMVKLHKENELENSKKLVNTLVVKVFGYILPFYVINNELRRQWSGFGNIRLTLLGQDWVLCSCEKAETMEAILCEEPWFVRGHIVGIDKWSPNFLTNSLKGLSAPMWIRLPNLPLYYWDDINISRIASLVGKPFLLDGNMFQWNRREFARICVRIKLDEQLPLGVWVEGEWKYEKVSKLGFKCGKIGHLIGRCPLSVNDNIKEISKKVPQEVVQAESANKRDAGPSNVDNPTNADIQIPEEAGYGPWVHVRYGKGKRTNNFPYIVNKVSQKPVKEIWKTVATTCCSAQKEVFVATDPINSEAFKAAEVNNIVVLSNAELEEGEIRDSFSRIDTKISSGKESYVPKPVIVNNNRFEILNKIDEEVEITINVSSNNSNKEVESDSELKNKNMEVIKADRENSIVRKKLEKELKTLGPIKLMTRSRKMEMGEKVKRIGAIPLPNQ
ncbi:hypothetical protein KFK09_014891 [Dendrobium nobile]|uniref:DUF4283 domain-containing protein n=1 Tax=Dendrobium nobile TaxID=94219 RepID=A0A8T3B3B3_DENNO|nr:hypothetical protein KFK09_014891 [Dendrobium nobile]